MEEKINVIFYKESSAFVKSLSEEAQNKVTYVVERVKNGDRDSNIFKKIGDLWEFRVKYNRICYRFLAFWDKTENRLIVVTHGFVKKTDKVPQKEIDKAKSIMNLYYSKKENNGR